ncbi:MAG: hypothetical protein FJ090_20800 [Deltaproteobacteria bacterium]|nr:hypothetical protein [Deltaproteobacteria bacterium]
MVGVDHDRLAVPRARGRDRRANVVVAPRDRAGEGVDREAGGAGAGERRDIARRDESARQPRLAQRVRERETPVEVAEADARARVDSKQRTGQRVRSIVNS